MAAVTGAVVVAAGPAYAAHRQSAAAEDAANASRDATNSSIAEQRRQFDITRNDQQPWLQAGTSALGRLAALNDGDYSGFENSPDYLYARDEGLNGINRHLAAKGGYYSGGGDADRMKFLSGLATQNLGNYRGSLQSLAGLGQSTASGLGSLGMGMASNIGNLNANHANAMRASAYGRADAYGQAAGAIGGAFNSWMQQRQAQQVPAYTGNGTGVGSYAGFGNNLSNFGGRP